MSRREARGRLDRLTPTMRELLIALFNHTMLPATSNNSRTFAALEERGLIVTERTSIITQDGRKQNGSLLYTILPIQFSIGEFYQRQMDAVDRAKERQRVARRMEQSSV